MQASERRGEAPQEEEENGLCRQIGLFSFPPLVFAFTALHACMYLGFDIRASECDSSYVSVCVSVCVCARVRAPVVLKRTAPAEQQQHQQQAL